MNFVAQLAMLCMAAALGIVTAHADDAKFGRELFYGLRSFSAVSSISGASRPATLTACVSCHGAQAAGKTEGGTRFPSLRWHELISATQVHAAYAGAFAVQEAISNGIGRGGIILSRVMPRYRLTDLEAKSLLAYLRIAGTETDLPPGVTVATVRLGMVLPLSGPLQRIGGETLAGAKSVIDVANRQGGIHGRHIQLATADSSSSAVRAAKTLVSEQVYAVFGSFWNDQADVEAIFSQHHIAMLGNLVPHARPRDLGNWTFDLLAPVATQQDVLVRNVLHCGMNGNRWLVQSRSSGSVRQQGVKIVDSESVDDATFTGDRADDGCIGYSIGDAASLRTLIPPNWEQRIAVPFPASLMRHGPAGIWRLLGEASARTTLEILAASGESLHELSPLQNISALEGFEPVPGAPIHTGKSRRFAWDPDVIEIEPAHFTLAPARTNFDQ